MLARSVADRPVRFVPRHTDVYDRVLKALPTDKISDMAAYEWMIGEALGAATRAPALGPMVQAEARALAIGEVPSFQSYVGTNSVGAHDMPRFAIAIDPFDLASLRAGRPERDVARDAETVALATRLPTLDDAYAHA
jgi:hypothetical protein